MTANRRHNRTITLPDADYDYLKQLGNNNASRGISKAVALLRKQPCELPQSVQDVIDAATLCNFCPSEGGYKDGISVEGCYERLDAAVQAYYGTDLPYPTDRWWSEDKLMALLKRSLKRQPKQKESKP